MAGDWIKMRADLFTHPKVVRMSSALKADTLRTVGGLMSAWCLFDAHSEDGQLSGYTPEVLDAHLRWPGFSAAMIAVDWLHFDAERGLELPRFDTHNGTSAKRRAQETDRKRAERAASKDDAPAVRKTSAGDADKKRTREEKRREEEYFDQFWSAYPRKAGKDAARKAFAKRSVDGELLAAMCAAIQRQGLAAKCARGESQYVPHPATWLNEGRWQDEDGAPANDDPYGLKRAL